MGLSRITRLVVMHSITPHMRSVRACLVSCITAAVGQPSIWHALHITRLSFTIGRLLTHRYCSTKVEISRGTECRPFESGIYRRREKLSDNQRAQERV